MESAVTYNDGVIIGRQANKLPGKRGADKSS